jgi:hypothetical protein
MSRFKIVRFWNSAAVAAFVTGAIFATTAVRADPLALVHPDRLLPQGFPSAATSADEANPPNSHRTCGASSLTIRHVRRRERS